MNRNSKATITVQQIAEADLLIESLFEVVFVFEVFRFMDGDTAKPAGGLAQPLAA